VFLTLPHVEVLINARVRQECLGHVWDNILVSKGCRYSRPFTAVSSSILLDIVETGNIIRYNRYIGNLDLDQRLRLGDERCHTVRDNDQTKPMLGA
jgi:hypothetical protein